jgi:hypothetical protein
MHDRGGGACWGEHIDVLFDPRLVRDILGQPRAVEEGPDP